MMKPAREKSWAGFFFVHTKKEIRKMMILNYESKKQLKESVGQPLRYTETSLFGEEFTPNGVLCGSNRPWHDEGTGKREFFAQVTMCNGVIEGVK